MAQNNIITAQPEEEDENAIYRGGNAGVASDFGLRNMFANSALSNMGLATQDQINSAIGTLSPYQSQYSNLAQNGMYSPQDIQAMINKGNMSITNSTMGQQQALNNQLAQRGLGGNAGASAALGMAGQFAGAGQRGNMYADLLNQNAQSKLQGLAGGAGIANQIAGLQVSPTQNTQNMMDLYNQWRQAEIGTGGYEWTNDRPQDESGYKDYWAGKKETGSQDENKKKGTVSVGGGTNSGVVMVK